MLPEVTTPRSTTRRPVTTLKWWTYSLSMAPMSTPRPTQGLWRSSGRLGTAMTESRLIAHGADINAKDKNGMTAMQWANTNKQTKVIDVLKEAGANEL